MSELLECLEHGAGTCRNADMIDELRAELARRDELIKRLKEDAERLADIVVCVENNHYTCNWCGESESICHRPDCPITLHRALMKELEC